jgi:hypothetical protein
VPGQGGHIRRADEVRRRGRRVELRFRASGRARRGAQAIGRAADEERTHGEG